MGIPAYFSYLIKNHPNIIKRWVKNSMPVNNLYLDSNSIIYDAVRNINTTEPLTSNIIIGRVIAKIEEYILLLAPDNLVYIAFDGVAPVAKLEQQRERRYKSWYQGNVMRSIQKKDTDDSWNTTAITPGTVFMKELNTKIRAHFSGNSKIMVSTSDEPGEGEHKAFAHIRDNAIAHMDSTTVIYGLDADLIMLSINHLPICPKIYLFRETPEFIKSIDSSLEPNETYLMDIPELTKTITMHMDNTDEIKPGAKNRVYDYIFLCFFLGNDFLPHFPALNIRTGGIDKILNAYKATIGGTADVLTDGQTIYWKNVRKVVTFLANQEEEYIKAEMRLRARREKNHYPVDTPEQKYAKFDAIPTYDRELEKYINPSKSHWQSRYYKALFDIDIDEMRRKQICINYLEGLEWTMKYYTVDCPDWRWCYKYNYPPLLTDLIQYIPYFDTTFIKEKPENPVSPLVQLCYVLPRTSLQFLPEGLYKKLLQEHGDWYGLDYDFMWAYCRYFWESHVQLPEIEIDELETFIEQNKKLC